VVGLLPPLLFARSQEFQAANALLEELLSLKEEHWKGLHQQAAPAVELEGHDLLLAQWLKGWVDDVSRLLSSHHWASSR